MGGAICCRLFNFFFFLVQEPSRINSRAGFRNSTRTTSTMSALSVSINALFSSHLDFKRTLIASLAASSYRIDDVVTSTQSRIPRLAARMGSLYIDLKTISSSMPRDRAEFVINALQAEGLSVAEFAIILDAVGFGMLKEDLISRANLFVASPTVNVTLNVQQNQTGGTPFVAPAPVAASAPPSSPAASNAGFKITERRRQVDLATEFGEGGRRVMVVKVPKTFNFDPTAPYVEMQNTGPIGIFEDWQAAEEEVSNIFGQEAEDAGGEHNVPHQYILAPLNGGVIGAAKRQFESKLLKGKPAARPGRAAARGTTVQARVQVSAAGSRLRPVDEEMAPADQQ